MEGVAAELATCKGIDHPIRQLRHQVANPCGSGTLPARNSEEGLGHRDRYFCRLKADDGAVTTDELEIRKGW
jgi:hypothetical protein